MFAASVKPDALFLKLTNFEMANGQNKIKDKKFDK